MRHSTHAGSAVRFTRAPVIADTTSRFECDRSNIKASSAKELCSAWRTGSFLVKLPK